MDDLCLWFMYTLHILCIHTDIPTYSCFPCHIPPCTCNLVEMEDVNGHDIKSHCPTRLLIPYSSPHTKTGTHHTNDSFMQMKLGGKYVMLYSHFSLLNRYKYLYTSLQHGELLRLEIWLQNCAVEALIKFHRYTVTLASILLDRHLIHLCLMSHLTRLAGEIRCVMTQVSLMRCPIWTACINCFRNVTKYWDKVLTLLLVHLLPLNYEQ